MGRQEKRKVQKQMRKKLTPEQFQMLQNQANKEIVENEVANQINFY
jgi:hypothetical protein